MESPLLCPWCDSKKENLISSIALEFWTKSRSIAGIIVFLFCLEHPSLNNETGSSHSLKAVQTWFEHRLAVISYASSRSHRPCPTFKPSRWTYSGGSSQECYSNRKMLRQSPQSERLKAWLRFSCSSIFGFHPYASQTLLACGHVLCTIRFRSRRKRSTEET